MNLDEITLTYAGKQETTAYTQEVSFTYRGEEYDATISWNSFDGFDVVDGWQGLPKELREDFLELARHLDILAFQAEVRENA